MVIVDSRPLTVDRWPLAADLWIRIFLFYLETKNFEPRYTHGQLSTVDG